MDSNNRPLAEHIWNLYRAGASQDGRGTLVKHSGKGGNARIRLIVLEAEVPDGDVSQLTQALQNALRPAPIIHQRVVTPPQQLPHETTEDIAEAAEDDAIDGLPPATRKASKPRRLSTPKYLDFTAEQAASWMQYAGAKLPKNDSDKYVLAVAWARDNVAEDGATSDHVYTCYRHMKWNIGIEDFGALLRSLKAKDRMKTLSRGKYAVTQLGLQRISEMSDAGS